MASRQVMKYRLIFQVCYTVTFNFNRMKNIFVLDRLQGEKCYII